MEKDTIKKLLALKSLKGYGNAKLYEVLASKNNLEEFFQKAIQTNQITDNDLMKAEKIIEYCKKNSVKMISIYDSIYPSTLKKTSSPPMVLFARGNLELLSKPKIAIVGTRKSSKETLDWVYQKSKELSNEGFVIVSGGALGVDIYAHKGALDANGNTICVLGCGFENIYPKENRVLIESIGEKGLLLSEYSLGREVNRIGLIERNKITSGISDGVIIASTDIVGGSMNQYKISKSQKKTIICPSPSLNLEPNIGIKKIIKDGKVNVITSTKDILNSLKPKNLTLAVF
ncbi:MAG: DNA-processing protein DprA [Nanoarchaeota archaeon]|nr:DNA-processing protein DprA [Nanoarchaeota archaeon]MBU1854084.1 DNA-processing protein DprA [Nanoarchaeota archaeon]